MLAPVKEHIENNFNPVPEEYIKEYEPVRRTVNDLMTMSGNEISTSRYDQYRSILAEADVCKDQLSVIRKTHLNRMQTAKDNHNLHVDMVYLNLLQESQQLLSVMCHQLRSAKKSILTTMTRKCWSFFEVSTFATCQSPGKKMLNRGNGVSLKRAFDGS